MSQPSRARVRLVLTATLAAAVALGSGMAAQGATARPHRDGSDLKTRAVNARLAKASRARTSGTAHGQLKASSIAVRTAASEAAHTLHRAPAALPAPPAPTSSTAGRTASRSAATLSAAAPQSAAPAATPATTTDPTTTPTTTPTTAAAPTCADLNLDTTMATDRTWVRWNTIGADSYTIWRTREGGTWQQLAVASSTQTSFLDTTVNPQAFFTYSIDAAGLSCDLGGWLSMSSDNGWGFPDAVVGTPGAGSAPGGLSLQDPYSPGMPMTQAGLDPALAPDGRRMAFVATIDGSTWTLDTAGIGYSGNSDMILTATPVPTGFTAADPAWSPDGRYVAYTLYSVDAGTGEVSGSQLHVLDPRTGSDRTVSGSDGLIQPDWRSTSSLVAAGLASTDGLFTLPAAGGTPVPVAGTANAGYPEVAPDGRIWFVEGDGTTFTLRYLSAQATSPVTVQSSTTHWYERPRVAPDGTVFVVDIDGHDLTNPDDNTFTVMMGTPGASMQPTGIGVQADGTSGLNGYDVRQPKSIGTSDFVGDAGPDILARDSAGTLWAYPSTPTSFAGARVRIGTGWNIYTAFIAAGDLNGDNRADILARDSAGRLWRYDGRGGGKVAPRVQIGSGWNGYSLVAVGDFNGSAGDLIARSPDGLLWLYSGSGRGTFVQRIRIGSGWNVMSAIVGVGDFDLDRNADVVAREASTGKLWLYPGNGNGGFKPRRQVGSGWNIFTALAGPELVGSNPVVYARRSDGRLLAYVVVGDGRFDGSQVYSVGTGWGPYSFTS